MSTRNFDATGLRLAFALATITKLAISLAHLAFAIGRNHSLLFVRMRTAFDQQSQIISPLVPPMKTFKHTHHLSLAFPTIIHFTILQNYHCHTEAFRIAWTPQRFAITFP
jgi:hypothetical protein